MHVLIFVCLIGQGKMEISQGIFISCVSGNHACAPYRIVALSDCLGVHHYLS